MPRVALRSRSFLVLNWVLQIIGCCCMVDASMRPLPS
jgi:hypothetical protein